MKVVRTNGLEIAYERVGEGPPLVFVHGAAEDGACVCATTHPPRLVAALSSSSGSANTLE